MDNNIEPEAAIMLPLQTGAKRKAAPSENEPEKRKRYYDADVVDNLSLQVSQIQKFLQTLSHQCNFPQSFPNDDDALSLNASGELFDDSGEAPRDALPEQQILQNNLCETQQDALPLSEQQILQNNPCEEHQDALPLPEQQILQNNIPSIPLQNFSLDVNTTLKEPSMPKTDPIRLERLKTIQYFNSNNWSEVRYSEAQKRFCSTPGFTNLECNDEIKPYDKYNHLALTEKGFAAITQGLLKQQESVESGIRELISWLRSSDVVELSEVENKIKDIFSGDFQKISNDLLQMACGHRADLIEQRRDAILRYVKDKFIRTSFRKIPPSCEFLFAPQEFASALDKNGGVNKIFWAQKSHTIKSMPTLGTKNNRTPAQGLNDNIIRTAVPAHGLPLNPYSFTPAQGAFQIYNPMMGTNFVPRTPTQGHTFRPRGPKPNQETIQRQTKSGPSRRGQARRKY